MNFEKINVGFIAALSLTMLIGYATQFQVFSGYESEKDYSQVMTKLQEGLIAKGYEIEKIQPIDKGLEKAGLKIEKYRVIFFNPKNSLVNIQNKFPRFSTLLPLSITIAKQNDKLKIIGAPYQLLLKNTSNIELIAQIKQWQHDSEQIIKSAL